MIKQDFQQTLPLPFGILYFKKREIKSTNAIQPVDRFFCSNINKMLKYLYIWLMTR